ncbi:MAG: arylsulfatase A-like enzyme [Verrucomicrobiales bacterium]|jgi:arylsulfatase A-like enzyme
MERIFTLAFLLFVCEIAIVPPAAAEQKPNVLFITIDDLNDWVGCLGGHPQARTPNLDALAERGVLFTNAHCNGPICGPSRTSLMTGLRPSTTGIYTNSDVKGFPIDAVTLPKHFEANGYSTLSCGKIFHGPSGKGQFQIAGPALGQGPLPKERFEVTDEASRTKLWDWGEYPPTNEEAHDFISATWAAERLAEDHEKPLFLGVGFYRPHVPCYAPPEWFENYPLDEIQLPRRMENDLGDVPAKAIEAMEHQSVAPPHRWFVENDKWKSAVRAYLASVEFMDHCLGKVVAGLDSGPQAENTWIFLTGDHGWHLGEKEHWAKRTLWERSTRVPMIVVPPRGLEGWSRGEVCEPPVEMLSFYPTLIEVCGLTKNEAIEGRSIQQLLADPASDWEFPAITTHLRGDHAVRSRHWRYIRYSDGSEELYDHREDPDEFRNLAEDPEFVDVIADHQRWLPETNAPEASAGRKKKN